MVAAADCQQWQYSASSRRPRQSKRAPGQRCSDNQVNTKVHRINQAESNGRSPEYISIVRNRWQSMEIIEIHGKRLMICGSRKTAERRFAELCGWDWERGRKIHRSSSPLSWQKDTSVVITLITTMIWTVCTPWQIRCIALAPGPVWGAQRRKINDRKTWIRAKLC